MLYAEQGFMSAAHWMKMAEKSHILRGNHQKWLDGVLENLFTVLRVLPIFSDFIQFYINC